MSSEMTMSLEDLSKTYSENNDDNYLLLVFKKATQHVRYWITQNNMYNAQDLPDEFSTEVALEYVAKLRSGKVYDTKASNSLKNLAKTLARKHVAKRVVNEVDSPINNNIEDLVEYKEVITKKLNKCKSELKPVLLYLVNHSDTTHLTKLRNLIPEDDFVLFSSLVLSVKNFHSDVDSAVKAYEPQSVIGRAVFLSMLLKKQPQLAELLILTGGPKRFFQFIMLNENRTFEIPPVDTFIQDLVRVSETVKRLETDDSQVGDLEPLKEIMVKGEEDDIDVLTDLSEFLYECLNKMTELNNEYIEKLMEKVKSTQGEENLQRLHDILNNQVESLYNLFSAIHSLSDSKLEEIYSNLNDQDSS